MSKRAPVEVDFTQAVDIAEAKLEFPGVPSAPDLDSKTRTRQSPQHKKSRRRTVEARRTESTMTELEMILASSAYPHLVEITRESWPRSQPGRPRTSSPTSFVVGELSKIYRTQRSGFRELRDPKQWARLVGTVKSAYPTRPNLWLPDRSPSRDAHRRARRHMEHDYVARFEDIAEAHGVEVRNKIISVNATSQYSKPGPGNVVYGDGSWHRSRQDLVTSGRASAPIPSGSTFRVNQLKAPTDQTGRRPRGTNVVTISTRNRSGNERVILATVVVPPGKNEGDVFVNWILEHRDQLTDVTIAIYDMALHRAAAGRLLVAGIIPIVKVPRDRRGRVDTANLGIHNFKVPDGTVKQLALFTLDGWAGVLEKAAGRTWFIPLTRRQVRKRSGSMYLESTIPHLPQVRHQLRGATVLIRLNSTDKETSAGIHRAAHLRAFPEGDPVFNDLFGLREDVESQHNKYKAHLWGRRARSVNADENTLDRAVWQILENTRASTAHDRRLARESAGPPLAA